MRQIRSISTCLPRVNQVDTSEAKKQEAKVHKWDPFTVQVAFWVGCGVGGYDVRFEFVAHCGVCLTGCGGVVGVAGSRRRNRRRVGEQIARRRKRRRNGRA